LPARPSVCPSFRLYIIYHPSIHTHICLCASLCFSLGLLVHLYVCTSISLSKSTCPISLCSYFFPLLQNYKVQLTLQGIMKQRQKEQAVYLLCHKIDDTHTHTHTQTCTHTHTHTISMSFFPMTVMNVF